MTDKTSELDLRVADLTARVAQLTGELTDLAAAAFSTPR